MLYYMKLINKTFKVNMQETNIQQIEQKLFLLAKGARENAYAPYSNFKVGAAIESQSGKYYAGCNVENISYPVGTCAEAGAIAAMVAAGDKQIKRILIIGNGKDLILPCGACLQRIKEFGSKETEILLADLQGIQKKYHIEDMLPIGFESLE